MGGGCQTVGANKRQWGPMKKLLGAVLLLCSLVAQADWTKFSQLGNNDVVVFHDRDIASTSPGIIRLWELYDLKTPTKGGYKSFRAIVELDCSQMKTRTLQDDYFSEGMANGVLIASNLTNQDWTFAPPGTLRLSILKAYCPQ